MVLIIIYTAFLSLGEFLHNTYHVMATILFHLTKLHFQLYTHIHNSERSHTMLLPTAMICDFSSECPKGAAVKGSTDVTSRRVGRGPESAQRPVPAEPEWGEVRLSDEGDECAEQASE